MKLAVAAQSHPANLILLIFESVPAPIARTISPIFVTCGEGEPHVPVLITYLTEQCDHMQLCDIFREENDYSFLRYHDDEQKTRRR